MMIKKISNYIFIVFIILICSVNVNHANTNSTHYKIPEWIYPKPFKYKANELPDPFQPFIRQIPTKSVTQKKKKGPLSPLEKISPTQLRLIGIVYSKDISPMALVELPDKKSYILEKGTLVGSNGGYVYTITKDRVIIKEPYFDLIEGKKIKEIELKLHPSEGEQK